MRLSAYVSRHPGWSGSSVANRFVDEALRMEDHPGVEYFAMARLGAGRC